MDELFAQQYLADDIAQVRGTGSVLWK